jgi:hypothetical protein
MNKYLFLILAFALLSSCFSEQLVVDPIPCDKFIDAKKNIEKAYLSQRIALVPASIEVTDEAIFLNTAESTIHNVAGPTTVHSRSTAIYFEHIENIRLIDDGNTERFEIYFFYTANKTTYKIFLYDKNIAIEGYSALKCMIEKAKQKSKTKEMY